MADILIDKKITQDEADKMMRPLELDLVAVFKIMEEEAISLLTNSDSGITPEELIDSLYGLLSGPEGRNAIGSVQKDLDIYDSIEPVLRRIQVYGMEVVIEQEVGSVRRGQDRDGNAWASVFSNAYGYFSSTMGADGDEVDVFVGENEKSGMVYIIHQLDPVSQEYDEDKVMAFFDSPEEAKKTYQKHYDRPGMFGGMTEVSIDQFKNLLAQREGAKLSSKGLIMPIPEPKPGETEKEYIPRCMSAISAEDRDQEQKEAICYSKYRDSKKEGLMKSMKQLKEWVNGKNSR